VSYEQCSEGGSCRPTESPRLNLKKGDVGLVYVAVQATEGTVRWVGHMNFFLAGRTRTIGLGPFTIAQPFSPEENYYSGDSGWIKQRLR
jgi:hypothetical protein